MKASGQTFTLVEHLAELRKRLIIIAAVNLAVALICYQYADVLLRFLLRVNPGMELIYLTPSELFMTYIKLSLICAVIFCFPITAMQIWIFVAEGLLKKEKFYGMTSLVFGVFFFLLGALFCYEVALPITLQFFQRITYEGISAMISVDSYVSFVTVMMAGFGAAFEMPVVVFLLSELELLKPETMIRARGVLILMIFIVAAIITPPDVISQIVLALPMCLLLQLSIWVCQAVARRKARK